MVGIISVTHCLPLMKPGNNVTQYRVCTMLRQLPLLHSLTANRAKMGTSMWQGLKIGYIGTTSRKTALYFRKGWEVLLY